jgi:PKD repeat protein
VSCTDDGTITARLTASDGLGSDQDTAQVTVTNVAPDLVLTAPGSGAEYPTPSAVTVGGSFTDPGVNDSHACTIDWSGTPASGSVGAGTCTGTRTLTTPGLHTIAMTVRDDDAGTDTESLQVMLKAPPIVDAGNAASGAEGSPIALAGSVNDPDDIIAPTWSYQVDSGDPGTSCTFADVHAAATTITCTDDGTVTATLSANDGVNATVAEATAVTIRNAAPALSITAPTTGGLYKMGSPVAVSAAVTDAGINDTQTCSITWDDGAATPGIAAAAGSCATVHTFTVPGVYTVALTATDDDGAGSTTTAFVVVYDPSAGFVTGGGTLVSPAGAYRPDPTLSGRATFGFVSKYQKGATTPTGQTEFQFHAAGLSFNSIAYQWLVVAGSKAQYKGTGTVNDSAGYGFLLTAYDGGKTGVDRLRMKVWQTSTGRVIYDNNVAGAGDDLDAADPQTISGGSIVIQR